VKLGAILTTSYSRAIFSFGSGYKAAGTKLTQRELACGGKPAANMYVPIQIRVSVTHKSPEKIFVDLTDVDNGTFIVTTPQLKSCQEQPDIPVTVSADHPAVLDMWDVYQGFYTTAAYDGESENEILGQWQLANVGTSVPGDSPVFPSETLTGPRVTTCAESGNPYIVPAGTISQQASC
jgi:hypothetical protein